MDIYNEMVNIKIMTSVGPQGNVLSLRPNFRGFKLNWGQYIFSGRKIPYHKSSGRDFKLWVPSGKIFWLVKVLEACKDRPLAKSHPSYSRPSSILDPA